MVNLRQLFANSFFRIPDYQRGYAWGDRQRRDFWEDICNLRDDQCHYTGTIVLRALAPEAFPRDSFEFEAVTREQNPERAYDVVDGQQRLTTAIILANELLRFLEQHDVHDYGDWHVPEIRRCLICRGDGLLGGYCALDYPAGSTESRHLQHAIYGIGPDLDHVQRTSYTHNLENAAVFFRAKVTVVFQTRGIEAVCGLLDKLLRQVEFNRMELRDDYNVGVAFETMNNRGRQLSNLELLKNRLMYLTELFDDNALTVPQRRHLRITISDSFRTIYAQLGLDPNVVLTDDEFLKAHWTVYFMYSRNRGDDYIRFLLEKQFHPSNVMPVGENEGVQDIVDPEEEHAELDDDADVPNFGQFAVRELTPQMMREYVTDLAGFAVWWQKMHFPDNTNLPDDLKVLLRRLRHIGMGYFKPLVAAALARAGQDDMGRLAEFLDRIEKFIFKAFRLGEMRSNYGQSEFSLLARRLYQGAVSLQGSLDWPRWEALQARDFVGEFRVRMADLNRQGEGFYKWKAIRYFLFEYNEQLARDLRRPSGITWDEYSRTVDGTLSVEHILPQTPRGWYWRNQFRAYSDNERLRLTGAIGNLLPLSQRINSALQNDPFEQKKNGRPPHPGRQGAGGYCYGSLAENEVGREQNWTAQAILERSHRLMDFLRNRWEVDMPEEVESAVLDLGFVEDGRDVPPEIPREDVGRNGRNIALGGVRVRRYFDVGIIGGVQDGFGRHLNLKDSAIAVVRAYLSLYPDATLVQLQQAFPRECCGAYEVVLPIDDPATRVHRNYSVEPENVITLRDGERIVVVAQWGANGENANWPRFMERARVNGVSLVENQDQVIPDAGNRGDVHGRSRITKISELCQSLQTNRHGLDELFIRIINEMAREDRQIISRVRRPGVQKAAFQTQALCTYLPNVGERMFYYYWFDTCKETSNVRLVFELFSNEINEDYRARMNEIRHRLNKPDVGPHYNQSWSYPLSSDRVVVNENELISWAREAIRAALHCEQVWLDNLPQ